MSEFDVLVLGGGPAGVNAALAASAAGLKVALFDENPAAGGQVYRAPVSAAVPSQSRISKRATRYGTNSLKVRSPPISITWSGRSPPTIVSTPLGPAGPVHCIGARADRRCGNHGTCRALRWVDHARRYRAGRCNDPPQIARHSAGPLDIRRRLRAVACGRRREDDRKRWQGRGDCGYRGRRRLGPRARPPWCRAPI